MANSNRIKNDAIRKQNNRIYQEKLKQARVEAKLPKVPPRDAFISLKHIDKIYPNKVQAVFDFNLDIQKHDFVVLVGPSGCGKSTTLRMIAGLEDITCGDLFINGNYANDLASKDRDIAMVFQSYALYPHMTVEQNMAFGLKIRRFPIPQVDKSGNPVMGINKAKIKELKRTKSDLLHLYNSGSLSADKVEDLKAYVKKCDDDIAYYTANKVQLTKYRKMPKDEIHRRVVEAAQILQIEEYLDRKPRALSGGQCQRVALGRSIVRNAQVFLMDEPLSNLDAKLRVTMRSEIIKLHNRLNATTIYVTHDQTEAMTMATKIVVMSRGYVQQIGTPSEIYHTPANIFVATFIGSPSMNLVKGIYSNGVIEFNDGDTVKVPKEWETSVLEFYNSEYKNYINERKKLLDNFVERKEVEKLLNNSTGEQKEELKKRLSEVESSNDRLVYLNKAIEHYKTFAETGEFDVIFGIRPEDIYSTKDYKENNKNVKVIEKEVSVSELTGLEFFVHIDYNGQDFVGKIKSKETISAGNKYSFTLDLNAAHIFDGVSEKLIK